MVQGLDKHHAIYNSSRMTITLTVHGAILAAEALTRRDGEIVDYRKIEPEWSLEDYTALVTVTLKTVPAPRGSKPTVTDEHGNIVAWL